MTIHLQRQIDRLKQRILALGSMVETAVKNATKAVEERDVKLAQAVIDGDRAIDMMEIEVEEECLSTFALHQPVAFDLRYVVAVLKINNDLERIADQASNIAEQVQFLADEAPIDIVPFDVQGMSRRVKQMLQKALESLVNVDDALAREVCESDDEVDNIHRHMYDHVIAAISDHPDQTQQLIHMMSISRNLERIADLATNIAEDVIYMSQGHILRHKKAAAQMQIDAN